MRVSNMLNGKGEFALPKRGLSGPLTLDVVWDHLVQACGGPRNLQEAW